LLRVACNDLLDCASGATGGYCVQQIHQYDFLLRAALNFLMDFALTHVSARCIGTAYSKFINEIVRYA